MFKKKLIDVVGPEAPTESPFLDIVQRMLKSGVKFKPGWRQSFIEAIEKRSGFRFPVDLREFWSVAVPIGGNWVDWESGPPSVQGVEDWIVRELSFDAQNNEFWPGDLGVIPKEPTEMEAELRNWVRRGPQLIPLHSTGIRSGSC